MSAQIVFLTLFLGLTSGIQQIDLHVDGPVRAVRILSGERELARMTAPPWNTKVDLGPLAPQELLAIGLDADGNEIARAVQMINLPRPTAEFEIALKSDGKQRFASLRWRHLMSARPTKATISVDGSPLTVDAEFRAALPQLDPLAPHVIAAEMRFEDGFLARKELVIQGLRSDSTGTQLTPVLLTSVGPAPKTFDGCFAANGTVVRANVVERPAARVMLVQDPYPEEAWRMLRSVALTSGIRSIGNLSPDTSVRITWPIARNYGEGEGRALLFDRSLDVSARDGGMSWFLSNSFGDRSRLEEPRHYAEAVAVAGLDSMYDGLRRAVVLVLSNRKDVSTIDPEQVRHYLSAIGVPLFVWSFSGPRPDLAKTWGAVDNISNPSLLVAATKRLQATLDAQRVAWLATDPLTALHVEVKPECGLQRPNP